MNFIKSTAISLLSLVLFLSLSLFSIFYLLGNTLLDPDFVTTEINRLDISSLTRGLLPMAAPTGTPDLTAVISKTVTDLEPWMKEEARRVIHTGYDYLLSRTDKLSLTISTGTVKDTLKKNITEAHLPDQVYQQVANGIPDTITESSISPNVMNTLKMVRSYLSYYQLAFYSLIALMVLCAAGIFLINRDVKKTTRSIGTTILVYGIIGYAIDFASNYFHLQDRLMEMMSAIPGGGVGNIPASLQTWLNQFMTDLMAPLNTLSIALLATGVALVIVSIVYPRRQTETE